MAAILRGVALAGPGAVLFVPSAQAFIGPVALHFSNPAWSGTVSFDDTTGVPWEQFPPFTLPFTAYLITDMTISDGTITWTEDELILGSTPPDGGLIVDSVGRVAL